VLLLLQDVQGDPGLHGDHREAVADHVVHLTGDPQALLVRGSADEEIVLAPLVVPAAAVEQSEQRRNRHHRDHGEDPGVEGRVGQAEIRLPPVRRHDHRGQQGQQGDPAPPGQRRRHARQSEDAQGWTEEDRVEVRAAAQVDPDADHDGDERDPGPDPPGGDAEPDHDHRRHHPRGRSDGVEYPRRRPAVVEVGPAEVRPGPGVRRGAPADQREDGADHRVDDEAVPGGHPHVGLLGARS
jgi:hypothetical protein